MNTRSFSHIQWAWSLVVILATSVSLALSSLVAGDLFVKPSQAAFPGENGMIAYQVPVENVCSASNPIYLINLDGTGKTSAPVTGFKPVWSPDGTKIAYYLDNYIHVAKADGSDDVALVQGDGSPTWSPDSKKLAFSRDLPGSYRAANIYVIDLETKEETQLTFDALESSGSLISSRDPTWHPDPEEDLIAFKRYESIEGSGYRLQGIWTIKPDGTGASPFVQSKATPPLWEFAQKFDHLDWSPDGDFLAVELITPSGLYDHYQIATVSWPDGTVTILSSTDEEALAPAWSPDGTMIAYISTRGEAYHVWVMDPNGGGVQQVTAERSCEWVSWQALPSKLIVNASEDLGRHDSDPGDGVCDTGYDLPNGDDECTFLAAIEEANARAGKDTITFDIPDGRAYYFSNPEFSELHITDPVVIDGTTQPGSERVKINNAWLDITAGNSEVRGLEITGFQEPAIRLAERGGNVLEGNFIGIESGAIYTKSKKGGILIESDNNRIGSADHDPGVCNRACNLITLSPFEQNETYGILIRGLAATGNVIQGNFIGTDITGMETPEEPECAVQYYGVRIEDGASQNVIGGLAPGEGNVISGNQAAGVLIDGSPLNVVQGNLIGIAANGVEPIIAPPNVRESTGVAILDSVGNEVIGNTIADINQGVSVYGEKSSNNFVRENIIGKILTTAEGATPIGNQYGVLIESDVPGTTVENNTIAYNLYGVRVISGVIDTTIENNSIHDNDFGIWLDRVRETDITANTIHHNQVGVWLQKSTGWEEIDHNRISANSIYDNVGLGLDLDPAGPTLNDMGDADIGPNGLLNYPVLGFAAVTTNGDLHIGATFSTGLGSKSYTIEFFANQACDESGYGEGERFLGALEVKTDLAGYALINTTFSQADVARGEFITATAIDQDGNTSEFSRCEEVLSGTTLSASATKGATTLKTDGTQGFAQGDYILINPGGDNQEDNRVLGFGSLRLATPLKFDHTTGELVVIITKRLYLPLALKQPAPP